MKINSLEEDLSKKNEKLSAFEDNIKTLTIDKERHEAQLISVRQVMLALTSELYHISGVRTRVQKVKPKMAEFEKL